VANAELLGASLFSGSVSGRGVVAANAGRDVPDIRFRFLLAGYPAVFSIRFRLRFRPKWCQVPDISTG